MGSRSCRKTERSCCSASRRSASGDARRSRSTRAPSLVCIHRPTARSFGTSGSGSPRCRRCDRLVRRRRRTSRWVDRGASFRPGRGASTTSICLCRSLRATCGGSLGGGCASALRRGRDRDRCHRCRHGRGRSLDSCKAPRAGRPRRALLGHAEAIGADVVLTTDRRWKRVSDRVHVV